jgi:hypothetical protein
MSFFRLLYNNYNPGMALACAMKLSESAESVSFLLTGGVSEMKVTLPRAAVGEIVSQVLINSIKRKFFPMYALYRTSDLCIPCNETARPCSQLLHYVSMSDLYTPWINLPIWLQQNRQTYPGNI